MSTLTNNLTQFCSDPDSGGATVFWAAGPHWQKGKQLERSPSVGYVPVAYSSQENIWVNADWNGNVDSAIQNNLYVYFEITVGGTTYQSSHTQLVLANGTYIMNCYPVWLDESFADIYGQQAMYDPAFQLTWKFYVGSDGSSKNRDAGVSTSCLYVTYDTPVSSSGPLYHSVVHIGCVAANGVTAATSGNADQPIFDAIWDVFEGKEIKKVKIQSGAVVDDVVLSYYGKESSSAAASTIMNGLAITSLAGGLVLI